MIKITADSTCDLPREITAQWNISLMPLHILLDDDDYRDGVDITPSDIFSAVQEQGKNCRTAAANTYEYEEFFRPFAEKYAAVVHISLGSGFSSSFQNAQLAASQWENVYVIDSQNLSTGSGYLVLEAAAMATEGADPIAIREQLETQRPFINASFVVDRLDYLHKGGRCSGIQMIGGTVLRIKPRIDVHHGKMIVGTRYRGSLERSLRKYVNDKLADVNDIDPSRILLNHALCPPDLLATVREHILESVPFAEIIEAEAGCTIASHCGPNTLGIMFRRKSA